MPLLHFHFFLRFTFSDEANFEAPTSKFRSFTSQVFRLKLSVTAAFELSRRYPLTCEQFDRRAADLPNLDKQALTNSKGYTRNLQAFYWSQMVSKWVQISESMDCYNRECRLHRPAGFLQILPKIKSGLLNRSIDQIRSKLVDNKISKSKHFEVSPTLNSPTVHGRRFIHQPM